MWGKLKHREIYSFKKISYFSFIKKLLFTKIFGKERKVTHKEVDTVELKKKKQNKTLEHLYLGCVCWKLLVMLFEEGPSITQPLLTATSLKGVLTVFSLKDQTRKRLLTKDAI